MKISFRQIFRTRQFAALACLGYISDVISLRQCVTWPMRHFAYFVSWSNPPLYKSELRLYFFLKQRMVNETDSVEILMKSTVLGLDYQGSDKQEKILERGLRDSMDFNRN